MKVPITGPDVMHEGGPIASDVIFNDTNAIATKVALNSRMKEKATVYCYSPENGGSLDIYDVDHKGNLLLVLEGQSITADTPLIYTHNHVCEGIYCIFTPDSSNGDDSDFLRVRALFGGV